MRAFFRRYRGLHIWLLSVCGVLALYFALRTVPGLMNWISRQVVMPLERAVAAAFLHIHNIHTFSPDRNTVFRKVQEEE